MILLGKGMWYDDEDDDDDGDDDDGDDDDDDDYDDVGLSTHASQIAFQTRVLAKHRFNLQKRQRPSACNQRTCACATAISRMTQCLDFTIDMYHNTARKKRQKSMLTPWLLEGKPVLARCLFSFCRTILVTQPLAISPLSESHGP